MNDYLILWRPAEDEDLRDLGSHDTLADARDEIAQQQTGTYFIARIVGSYKVKRETVEKVSIDYHPTTTRTRKVKA